MHAHRFPAGASLAMAATTAVLMATALHAAASSVARPVAKAAAHSRRASTTSRPRAHRKTCTSTVGRARHASRHAGRHTNWRMSSKTPAPGRCAKGLSRHSYKRSPREHPPESNTIAKSTSPAEQAAPLSPGASAPPAPEPSGGSLAPNEAVTPGEPDPPTSPASAPFRFFSPSSFWNVPVPASAALDPKSGEMIGAFSASIARQALAKLPPWINTTRSSIPLYTVPADQPTTTVTLENASGAPALQEAWNQVPLPPTAKPAEGSDKVLILWQPSTDRLWDFWRLSHTTTGWQASWGGAMQKTSSNPGVYGPEAWPGAKPWWGDSASSLEPIGGLITLEDLQLGEINHAIAIAIPNVRAGTYAAPAQRTDGKATGPLTLPEGAHLRLDPKLDLATLHLPHITQLIAEAAQRYGLLIRDYAPDVTFYAQDPSPTATNPYTSPTGYFEGKTPKELLANFPWNHLQVLKMHLHKTGVSHRRRGRRADGR